MQRSLCRNGRGSRGLKRMLRALLPLLVAAILGGATAWSQSQAVLTISKTNDATTPIESGRPITFTITYNWSGGVPAGGTLEIQDVIPAGLQYLSNSHPGSTTLSGSTLTYTRTGITSTAGSETWQINMRFPPGITCPGQRVCNTAQIRQGGNSPWVTSNESCVTATAKNNWTFEKEWFAGCAVDDGIGPDEEVIYRIKIINPSGIYGGLNLTNLNLTDILPANARVTGVSYSGSTWASFSPASGLSPVTIYPPPASLDVSYYWYLIYVRVKFPSAFFTAGQTVTNTATLSYTTVCDSSRKLTFTDTARTTLCAPVTSGGLSKSFAMTTYNPSNPYYYPSTIATGCCGTYYITYQNTGNTGQSNVRITDNVPHTVDVSNIQVHVPSGMTAQARVYCWSSGSCVPTPCATSPVYSTSATYTPGVSNICKIEWIYTGTLPIATSISNSFNVCIRTTNYATGAAVVAGQAIANTAIAEATGLPTRTVTHTMTVSTTSPQVIAQKTFVGKCNGCTAQPNGPFFPGDIVRFRMAVANLGSAPATGCTITDALPAGLIYQGNETYYYGAIAPPGTWLSPYSPPCCSLKTLVENPAVLAPVGGTISKGGTPSNPTWTFPTLPKRCDGTPEYFIIEFDVKISDAPPALPGQYRNNFTFSAGNLGSPVTSNYAYMTVNAIVSMIAKKEVRQKPSGTFSSSALMPPGLPGGEYRLTIKNTGNTALQNVCLLDIMPHVADLNVLPPYTPGRGSLFNIISNGGISVVSPAGFNIFYNSSATTEPSRTAVCGAFCGITNPGGAGAWTPVGTAPGGGTYSFSVSAGTGITLAPGATLEVLVPFTIPAGTNPGDRACNSFAYQCSPVGLPSSCLSAEPTAVCVIADSAKPTGCALVWRDGVQDTSCCRFNGSAMNALGNITSLRYNVLNGSGVVQSFSTSPCLPSSTIPLNLAGTTSGTLNFTGCTSPVDYVIEAAATNASGLVCIELIAYIQGTPAQPAQICRDTICIQCRPAPKTRCDSATIAPFIFTGLDLSGRTITIYNQKIPASPIKQVKISLSPDPNPGGGPTYHWNGGDLRVDAPLPGFSRSWGTGNSGSPWYSLISMNCPGTGGAPQGASANNTVRFNLGVDYTLNWVGTVNVTIIHCDGDSCTRSFEWCAKKFWWQCPMRLPQSDVILRADSISATLFAGQFQVRGDDSVRITYATIEPIENGEARIFAMAAEESGRSEKSGGRSMGRITHSSIFSDERGSRYAAMVEFGNGLRPGDTADVPFVVETPASQGTRVVRLRLKLYDENGNIVQEDSIAANSTVKVGGTEMGKVGSADAELYNPEPTPTSGRVRFGYRLSSSGVISLELYDARGSYVARIENGRREAGEHAVMYDTGELPSGTYLLQLTTPLGVYTRQVIVQH